MKLVSASIAFSAVYADLISYKHQESVTEMAALFLSDSTFAGQLFDHGCWCAKIGTPGPASASLGGKTPTDELDQICKDWAKARRCSRTSGSKCEFAEYSSTYEIEVSPQNCVDSDACLSETCHIDYSFISAIEAWKNAQPGNPFTPVTGVCTPHTTGSNDNCVDFEIPSTLIMKMNNVDDTFAYNAAYWENNNLLNENSLPSVMINAKYPTFLNTKFNKITVCAGSENENCYSHKFENTVWNSAKELFSAGYVREALDVDAIVLAHQAVGLEVSQYEKNCPMQNPGFNAMSTDNCRARFGFCWNVETQVCGGDLDDADGSIGIGLYSQNGGDGPKGQGAGWTYHINNKSNGRTSAWVYVNLV